MIASAGQVSYKGIGELAILDDMYLYPIYRAGIYIVPVLAGHSTCMTTCTTRLIKEKA
jgi:hypothetical protein